MFAFVAYFSRASDRHWFLSVINALRLFSDGYGTVGIGTFNSLQIGSHPSFGLKINNFSSEKSISYRKNFQCDFLKEGSKIPRKIISLCCKTKFEISMILYMGSPNYN